MKRELNDHNINIPGTLSDTLFDNMFDVVFDNLFMDIKVHSDLEEKVDKLKMLQRQIRQLERSL